jgi:hypothetical protein
MAQNTWLGYYWAACKQLGKETYRTWRVELFSSVVIGFFVATLSGNWKDFKTALFATGITLGIFIAWHLIRIPWLLHTSQKESDEHLGLLAGVFGLIVTIGFIVGGIELGHVLLSARPPCRLVSTIQAPPAPNVKIENNVVKVIQANDVPMQITTKEYGGWDMAMSANGVPQKATAYFILGLTNKTISPVHVVMTCDQEFFKFDAAYLIATKEPVSIVNLNQKQINSRTFEYDRDLPAWTPESPLGFGIVTLSTSGIGCKIAQKP